MPHNRLIRADEMSEMTKRYRDQLLEGLIILTATHQVGPALRVGPESMIPSAVSHLCLTSVE
jgi:hypothetical protein